MSQLGYTIYSSESDRSTFGSAIDEASLKEAKGFTLNKPVTALIICLIAAMANVNAQAPTQPTLPQKTVILTLPTQGTSICPTLTTGSNCIRNLPAGNSTSLQNAINAATCGDTIVLAAGSTYSGHFTIPSTSCSGWIEIKSSAMASLPSRGNRVSPSDASNMAIISTPDSSPAIQFLPNANHWRLMGLEITTSSAGTVYNLVLSGWTLSSTEDTLDQMPSYLIFDRCYLTGSSTNSVIRGIWMDSTYMAIVDSYCDEIHTNYSDTQCFASFNGPGPYLIQNNFIQAAGENIMFGGDDPSITNLIPSDITIIGNLIQKKLSWRSNGPPYTWVIKNLLELKNAQRVLVDGNVFQYTWQQAQAVAILYRSVNQGGACTWCSVLDITTTHNIISHAPNGVNITAYATSNCVPTGRVRVSNNRLTDISGLNWGNNTNAVGQAFNTGAYDPPDMHDIIIDHNTAFSDRYALYTDYSTAGDVVQNVQYTNNLQDSGISGVSGTSAFEPGYSWNPHRLSDVVLMNATAAPVGGNPPIDPGISFTTYAGAGFTSYSGSDPDLTGNFQLTSSSSYHNAGTDGKDIGVWDWICLNNDSAAALAGKFVPSQRCVLSGILLPTLLPQPPAILNAVVQ